MANAQLQMLYVSGPQGVVRAEYPVIYNAGTQTVSIDTRFFSGIGGGVTFVNGQSGAVNIFGTGGNLFITQRSGDIFISGSGLASTQDFLVLTQQLVDTGSLLWNRDNAISGALQGQITANSSGSQILVTGSSYLPFANFTGVGNAVVFTSGNFVFISGVPQIFNAVTSLNGLQNSVNISATGGLSLAINGQTIVLSGDTSISGNVASTGQQAINFAIGGDTNLSGNLTQTGATLNDRITLLSGGLQTGLTNTGVALVAYADSVGVSTSGSLASTGQQSIAFAVGGDTNLSGALTASGSTLFLRDSGISGGLETRIAQTGRASVLYSSGISGALQTQINSLPTTAYVNSVGTSLSGDLTQTGIILSDRDAAISGGLESRIAVTGQAAVAATLAASGSLQNQINNLPTTSYVNSVGNNLSGNLTTTGAVLNNRIGALSGFTIDVSGALQAQIGAANGTQVQVTGSSTLSVANFTGIGGAIVFTSGDRVFISGGAGGAAGVTSLNSLVGAVNILGTGLLSSTINGQTIILSGDNSISGALTLTGQTLQNIITNSGSTLFNRDASISGGLETRIAVTGQSAFLATSGASGVLQAQISALPTTTYVNGIGINLSGNLTQTGIALQNFIFGGDTNLSGALTQTGSTLFNRDTSISGGLEARISATGQNSVLFSSGISGVLQNQINGLPTTAYVNGIGVNLSGNLAITGQTLQNFVFGGDTNLSGNLTQTGATLFNRDASISGGLEVRITQTGNAAITHANGIGAVLSGNLTLSGQALLNFIFGGDTNLSGNLTQTGSTLFNRDASISGGLEARIFATGNAAIVHANGIGSALSGDLTQTGNTLFSRDAAISGGLEARIALTGQSAFLATSGASGVLQAQINGLPTVAYVNGMGVNLSGNLTQTGITLQNNINSLSGFTLSASGALQDQISAGNGTQVRITGSSTLVIADLTGIGGTLVFSSGGQVFISGGAGGGGGVTSLNGLVNAVNILGTGLVTSLINGQTIIISGDTSISGNVASTGQQSVAYTNSVGNNLSGNLSQTGATLLTTIFNTGAQSILYTSGASGVLQSQINGLPTTAYVNGIGINLSGNLASSGQVLQNFIFGGDTNISGNLTQTGATLFNRDAAISGGLEARIALTGQSAFLATSGASGVLQNQINNLPTTAYVNGIGVNLSGNLTSTGQTLLAFINGGDTNLSGNLTLTGQTLFNRDASISGGLEVRITQTGQVAFLATSGASGVLQSQINALPTTSYVNGIGINLSGNLTTTGQTLQNFIFGGDTNLSGNLTQTGATLFNRDAAISGGLEARIALTGQLAFLATSGTSGVLQNQINALPTTAYVNGIGISLSGNLASSGATLQNFIFGGDTNLSGNLTQTGATLFNRDTSISGGLETRIALTGQNAFLATSGASGVLQTQINNLPTTAYVNGIGINLSGNLASSGQVLQNFIFGGDTNLSGNLTQTGVTLFSRDNAISGGLETRIALTGQNAFLATSGASGVLQAQINNLPTTAYVNGIGVNLSGDLTQTGIILQNNINSLSGFTLSASGALQAQISAGNGTQVRITGSTTLTIADFTGIGGTLVFWSGGQVFISGGAGGGGGVTSLNGVVGAVNLLGTGLVSTSIDGQTIIISGDNSISGNVALTGQQSIAYSNSVGSILSGNMAQTGATLLSVILNTGTQNVLFTSGASGVLQSQINSLPTTAYVNGIGINLSGNLTTTGQTLQNFIFGGDTNLSGNLTQTGATLFNRDAAISGGLEARISLTGQSAFLATSGASGVLQSQINALPTTAYVNGIGINLSGNLASSGVTLQNFIFGGDTNLSGALTSTGVTLIARDNSISGWVNNVVSGGLESRIAQTGSAAVNYANGIGVNISGNLTTTGQTLDSKINSLSGFVGNVSGGLEARLAQTGNLAIVHANSIGNTISGNLTLTGKRVFEFASGASGELQYQITQSGLIYFGRDSTISGVLSDRIFAVDYGLFLTSGDLTTTGQTLNNRIISLSGFTLGVSGALQDQISAGGSQVRVTGSSNIGIADFTGVGSVRVFTQGSQIFITGTEGGPGGGVSSLNGLTNAVNINGTGGLVTIVNGQNIIVSGFNGVTGKFVLFNYTGTITGEVNFAWDHDVDSLTINQPTILPNNPLAIAGNVNSYLQTNLQNRSAGASAATEYVATNNLGSDTTGYVAMGINSSNYSDANYQITSSGDAYLFSYAEKLVIGTAATGGRRNIVFHTDGSLTGNARAIISTTGINLIGSGDYQINGRSIVQPMMLTFTAGAVTATNMPAALSFFANSSAYITFADLSRFTGMALYINKAGTAGAAASQLFVRYRDAFNATATNWTQDITSPVMQFPVNTTNTMITSGFRPLVAGARSGVFIALMGTGGDGVLDPAFGLITAQFM